MITILLLPCSIWDPARYLLVLLLFVLVSLQLPMALRLARPMGIRMLAFIPFGFLRAYWRSFGMAAGLVLESLNVGLLSSR